MVGGQSWCSFSPKCLCHKAVYIRHFRGTRELKTPSHASLPCACCHSMMWWCFSSTVSLRDAGLVWQAPAGGVCRPCLWKTAAQAGQAAGRLCSVPFLQGTVLWRRMGTCIPSCKATTGLGFSNQTIFSTALFATALSWGGSFGNGGGDGELLQFCFYK